MRNRIKNYKLRNNNFLFLFLVFFLFIVQGLAQQPKPVVFKPLAPPITDVYQFESAGLIVLSNKRELQFWDATTKAYFGFFGVLPVSAFNYSIRIVEYLPAFNTVAVVWEEFTLNGKDSIYKDFLSVINLNTLALAQPIERNGMLAFIKYKYDKQFILPELKAPEKIYNCYYSESINSFFTTSRNGLVSEYKNGSFVKSIETNIKQTKLFVTDSTGKYLLMADAVTAVVNKVNIKTEKILKIANLQPIETCQSRKSLAREAIFDVKYIIGTNSLVLTDSINRIQTFNASTSALQTVPFTMVGNKLVSVNFNPTDSTFLGILESDSSFCQRTLFSTNLKTGLTNYFTGGSSLRITSSFYASTQTSLRFIISGIAEQEINLNNLSGKTNNFLVAPSENNLRFTGKWEKGYVSVFDQGDNKLKLKVYESIYDQSILSYTQQIQCNDNEDFVALEAKRKWFATVTKPTSVNATQKSAFTIYDSTGKKIFQTAVSSVLQVQNYYPYEQRIFSGDGRFFLLKESFSIAKNLDSCRLRVFNTTNFKQIVDLHYNEISDGISLRYTAYLADSVGKIFYTAAKANESGNLVNFLYCYNLNEPSKPIFQKQLYIDPSKEDLAFDIKTIRVSKGEEIVLWTGSTNDKTNGNPMFYQAVRGASLKNTKDQWGINLNVFPEVQNVLLLKNCLAIQLDDHFQLYKWSNNLFENFLTLIPVYNEKTAEASTLFVAFDKNSENFTYYEKTGNDDCISFRFANHSYRRRLFDLTFNRPDLIIEQIPDYDTEYKNMFRKAVIKRGERITNKLQGFKPELLPTISIKNTGYMGSKFRITLNIKSKLPVTEIWVSINGCEQKKSTNLSMQSGEAEYNLFETLSVGENVIEITAVTKTGNESMPFRLIQNHNKQQDKPALHVLIVSVGEYISENANLPFAVKDGRDMCNLFAHQLSDTLFNYIKVDTLYNKAATSFAVEQWLKQKKDTDPNDYVIVFYSGHGLLNKENELQLATSNTIFDNAENTIDFKQLLLLLDNVTARQKLLLIDACHSGDLDKSATIKKENITQDSTKKDVAKGVGLLYKRKKENAFEIMQNLFSFSEKGSGTVVFSASGGMQSAFEGANFQNGYFTYALKDAILYNKAAEAQQGMLWLNQLIKYVTKRVVEISAGKQTPNLRISHPDINWRIK